MATSRVGSSREGTAKTTVAEQISQAVQSTSNLIQLMQQSSTSYARLAKLPKTLLAKTVVIRNTGQVLEQLPLVISSVDAHMDHGLNSAPQLETVVQLLANMDRCRLNPLYRAEHSELKPELSDQSSETG